MSTAEELQDLIQRDADEVLAAVRVYDSRRRFRLMRAAAHEYAWQRTPIERVKTVWALQALLSTTKDRRLPIETGIEVATRLARITRSHDETAEARHGALDSLALVFIKTKTLTERLDKVIRGAFASASRSNDRYLSEFAGEALSGEGLLASRRPFRARTGVLKVAQRFVEELLSRAKSPAELPLPIITRKPAAKKQAQKRYRTAGGHTEKHI